MTTLYQIAEGQAQPATAANENFAAVAPAGLFGKKATTTTGLTFGYFGGIWPVDGVLTAISDGTVSLTGSTTNYIEASHAGVVSANTTGFTAGATPLFTVTTTSSAIDTITDYRAWARPAAAHGSVLLKTWPSDADYELTAAEARASKLVLSGGSLSATRELVVPVYYDAFVFNGTSGSQSIRVQADVGSPSGAGITIANGMGAFVFGNGAGDIIRASADV